MEILNKIKIYKNGRDKGGKGKAREREREREGLNNKLFNGNISPNPFFRPLPHTETQHTHTLTTNMLYDTIT